ncbi:WD40 repeat domain-containing protein [Nonomuraea sp. B1E8]|uniref:WD40 repeat domain-containing protein n=1 Tax=unclassified Nonomuraea TaxID=2593643 RepID=UPI00325EAD9A
MTAPILSSQLPAGRLWDLDLVTIDGRLLVVCAVEPPAWVWEPSKDRWTQYRLDMPYRSDDFRALVGHLPTNNDKDAGLFTRVCAAVVDGRIVVGGAEYRESFAQWDLASGAVRVHARLNHGGTGKVATVRLNGRPFFISCSDRTYMWDAAHTDTNGATDVEPAVLYGDRDTVTGIAAGTLNGRPVVIFGSCDDSVVVWGVDTQSVVREFPCPLPVADVGLATVDGRLRMVAAGGDRVILGDPDTGAWEWEGPIDEDSIEFDTEFDEENEGEKENSVSCMDVGVVGGRPVAVTGSEDGRVCVWSLAERRLVHGPFDEHHGREVVGVRVADWDGRTVAITAGEDGRVLVWNLERS